MKQTTAAVGIEWGRPTFMQRMTAAAIGALLLAAPVLPGLAARNETTSSPVSVIVRAVPGAEASVERAIARLGGTVTRRLGIIGGVAATVPSGNVSRLETSGVVEAVTPDGHGHLLGTTDTSTTTTPFAMPQNVASVINSTPAYAQGLTGAGVTVALIDSGVSPVNGLTYPGKVVNGPDLSFDSQAPNLTYLDGYGHGTHMAGLIAGRDDNGPNTPTAGSFTGVAPDARILNVKVGSADGAVDVSQVIAAIDWVAQHRNDNGMNVRVLNLSFGTDSTQSYLLDPLAYATEVAWQQGLVVVVAGGNDGKQGTILADPAIDPYVIAVGADDPQGTVSTSDDKVADFSSRGNTLRHVDVIAPGKSMVSLRDPGSVVDDANPGAVVQSRFFLGSGTSQAAAVTSGAAALLLQQRPWLNPDQVKSLLMGTAVPVNAGNPLLSGNGIINVGAAMTAAPSWIPQAWPASTGTGTLEGSRGSVHVYDPVSGVALTGEQDIFGHSFDSAKMAKFEAKTNTWNGGSWNGSQWTGSSWSGSSWSGSSWSGSSWSGSSWSGSSWSSVTWASNTWNGSSWSGSSWSGSSWSGSSWSGSSWSGSSWSGSSWS